jgi:NRPS condensation-like uncharacterized protein
MAPNLGSRSRIQLFRQAGWGECWRAFRNTRRQPVENLWRFPSNNREETGGRMYSARRLEPPRFDTLRRHARQFGATLNDVFVAAYFRSLWEFLDFPAGVPQAIVLPMNLRRYLPSGKAEAICNFTAPLLPSLARVPGEPFEGTLQRVRERTLNSEERKQRALVASLAISLGGRLALPRIKKKVDAERRKNVADGRTTAFLSNNGAFDPEQLDFGIPVKDGYQILPTAFAPGLFLAIMSFRKTLHFTISYSSVAMNRDDVERFLDLFLKQLPDSA